MFPVDTVDKPKIDTSDERKALDTFDDKEDENKDKLPSDESKDDEKEKEDTDEDDEDKEELTEKDEEDEDKKETKEDEEEEEDEDLKADSLYQQIKKSNPKLLKEIPELRSVIFREQKYTEIFPSLKDAEDAAQASETFQAFQEDIESGNPTNLLSAIETIGKDSLTAFVSNFLPALEKQSKDLYLETLYPEFKKLFRAALRNSDQRIVDSAKNLNYFIFGDFDIEKDVGLKPIKKDEKEDSLSKREKAFEERIYTTFFNDVLASGTVRTKKIISSAFKDSDVSELMQRKLVDEIYDRVEVSIKKDPRHMGNMGNLWKQAKAKGFTSDYKDRIITAYLSRAKLLIPKVRQQVLSEAKVSVKERTEEGKKPTRIPSSNVSGKQGYKPGEKVDPSRIDWDKTSERDALDGRFTYKK